MIFEIKHLFDRILLSMLLFMIASQVSAVSKKPTDSQKLLATANRYMSYEQYTEALPLYIKVLEKAESEDDKQLQAICLGNIGNIYGFMENTERAIYYYKKGFDISTKEKSTVQQLKFAINLVACYCMQGDLQNAQKYYKTQMSLPYKSNPMMRYYAYCNASSIAMLKGNVSVALYHQQQALQLVLDSGMDPAFEGAIHHDLGKIYYAAQQYSKAIEEYKKSCSIFGKIKRKKQEATVFRDLYVVCNRQKNNELAVYYKNRYLTLIDSLFDQQRMNAASAKLFDYEKQQNDMVINRLTNHNSYLMVSTCIFLLLAVLIAYLYFKLRQRNRHLLEAQRILVEKNEELLRNDAENQELRRQYIEIIDRQKDLSYGIVKDNTDSLETTSGSSSQEDEKKCADRNLPLSQEQTNRLLERINQVLADVNVISKVDFSLSMLAQMVDSNTKYVSTVINETYHKNFKSYLNDFRIREACRRLCDTDNYGNFTIQTIYQNLGYKTATGFIQAFRKINGMTPSQYQKLKREQSENKN